MKVIIAGSRDVPKDISIEEAIKKSGFELTELVCGMARGIDTYAFTWANCNNIPIKRFYADWNKYGKSAGPIRNREMAEYGDCLIAIWDGKSKGTKNMIETMRSLNKEVFIWNI